MKIVADLHLHSSYARATARNLNFETLSSWARMKGINLLSSADFTHPVWFKETQKILRDNSSGLYEFDGFKFILGSEISCIYSQGGKVRRIHCLVYAPDLSAAERINQALSKRGNLASDGRPIIGMSARNLLEIILEAHPDSILIPAHAWTPWFSLYGANSGFDSIEEAFGDLKDYIYAIETGLSSNPAMNWRIKDLDTRSIVSFSDAHSAPKMGRELTILETEASYQGFLEALKKQKISETIEFFPEEGKYHFTGHRACFVRHSPEETDKLGLICPKCKKTLTVGVMHRVEQLAEKDRAENFAPEGRPKFKMLVPLLEIIAESVHTSVNSNKVVNIYQNLIKDFETELSILTEIPTARIGSKYGPKLEEAIAKVRQGSIVIEPGYDGVFGVVKIWPETKGVRKPVETKREVRVENLNQIGLFDQ